MEVYLNFQTALYYITVSNFHLLFNAPNILLRTFLPKAAGRSAIRLFNVQDSAAYVATGLFIVL